MKKETLLEIILGTIGGIITGVVGLLICVLNYPIYAYITKK